MKRIITVLLLLTAAFIYPANDTLQTKGQPSKLTGSRDDIKMNPQWSPDGKYLAYTAEGYRGIWVMDTKTQKVRRITDEAAAGFGFEWSNDSKSILTRVAKYQDKKRLNAVKLFDIETGKAKRLAGYRSLMPGLPHFGDRDQKVFMYGRGKLEVFLTGKKASALQKATQSTQIFFPKDDQIASGNILTKSYKVLDPINKAKYLNLTVSPDQSKVAFEIMGGNMYVMNSDGTGLTDLGKGFRPRWSPDSKSLVYMISQDDGHTYTSSDIYIINADGTGKQNITNSQDRLEMNPSWSPDGSRIAFDEMNDGAIYILELAR